MGLSSLVAFVAARQMKEVVGIFELMKRYDFHPHPKRFYHAVGGFNFDVKCRIWNADISCLSVTTQKCDVFKWLGVVPIITLVCVH
ncbi:hypothetical protein Sjap_008497 [Stephania japonica]|uniref:Uncharacterized protein n=1 Tax=Stephania japonica TaxID=461633 RepID=A0AAP0PAX7_9MAGN